MPPGVEIRKKQQVFAKFWLVSLPWRFLLCFRYVQKMRLRLIDMHFNVVILKLKHWIAGQAVYYFIYFYPMFP